MHWVIAEDNRYPSASMRAPVSVIFIGSDWGWWGSLKLAALLFSMGLSDWWLLLCREGVFPTACTLGLISGTSGRSSGVCVYVSMCTPGMACTFCAFIRVHACNVKEAERRMFRRTVGCIKPMSVCLWVRRLWLDALWSVSLQTGFSSRMNRPLSGSDRMVPLGPWRDIIPHRTWPWAAFRSVRMCKCF